MFDRLEENLATGKRTWWDEASADFIENVGDTGRPFYTRLVPGALSEIPGLDDRLTQECRIMDTACGSGVGLVRLATAYPDTTVVGADGDAHSLELAQRRAEEAGVADRVELIHSPLEAQIDDQLLPRHVYDDLLSRHGFTEIGSFQINPTHAVTYGRA